MSAAWITNPPDMIDAPVLIADAVLPFGVVAMWAIFAVALLAALRRRLGLRLRTWRVAHMVLAIVIVAGENVHGHPDRGHDGDGVEGKRCARWCWPRPSRSP